MPHDDFAVEPIAGLPELPPEGEVILWQGKPDWWALCKESLSLKWVLAYFVFLAAWRFVSVVDLMPLPQAIGASVPFLILGAIVLALLTLTGWVQAICTVYTVTNRRVALRIGAALTVTLNVPYTQVNNIGFDRRKSGTGTLAFDLKGDTRLSYLVCWPHVRPWKMRNPQPALRCIPDADKVAQMIAEAAEARVSEPKLARNPVTTSVAAE